MGALHQYPFHVPFSQHPHSELGAKRHVEERRVDMQFEDEIMMRQVLERAERIVLFERYTERVLKLLENPPKPSPALLAAARRRSAREFASSIKAGGKRSKP